MLLTILILIVIVTAIGVSMLSTTILSGKQSGSYRARGNLEQLASSGLELARLRLQNVALDTDGVMHPAGLLAICTPTGATACTVTPEPSCPAGNPDDSDKGIVTPNSNVICNLLGTSFKDGRVVLVRKDDYTDPANGWVYAQLLLNVVASDVAGRRKILQGGMLMRYAPSVYPLPVPPAKTPLPIDLLARQWLND